MRFQHCSPLPPQGTLSISTGAVVDREHEGVLTDSQGRGVVTFTIEATNVGASDTLSSAQDAQVLYLIIIFITDDMLYLLGCGDHQ